MAKASGYRLLQGRAIVEASTRVIVAAVVIDVHSFCDQDWLLSLQERLPGLPSKCSRLSRTQRADPTLP